MKDISRKVKMDCPICSSNQFEYDPELESTTYTCSNCGKEFTKDELIEGNEYKINAVIEDIKKEVAKEVEKDIKKILKDLRSD